MEMVNLLIIVEAELHLISFLKNILSVYKCLQVIVVTGPTCKIFNWSTNMKIKIENNYFVFYFKKSLQFKKKWLLVQYKVKHIYWKKAFSLTTHLAYEK